MSPPPSTAQASAGPDAVTPYSVESCSARPTTVQAVPSQCSVTESYVPPSPISGFSWSPTAQISVAETAVTARRLMPPPLALTIGAATVDQAVPSQCSMMSPPPAAGVPTAHTSLAATAVTPWSAVCPGLDTTDQLVPFQCSINDSYGQHAAPPSPRRPTAQRSLLATPAIE